MLRIIAILFSLSLAYLNFIIYKSYVVQAKVTADFNQRKYEKENFILLQNIGVEFPNLSGTGFPMYGLLANYQLMFGDLYGALKTLDKFENVNPYLRIKESIKTETYLKLGIRDSSYHYSKIAFDNLPKNARHFQQYFTELTWRKDLNEINEVFRTFEDKNNPDFWLFYFSAVINLKKDNDKKIDSLAKVALNKFPSNEKIRTISGYILYGQDNIKKSYSLSKEGIESFKNSDFESASVKFVEAFKLNPIDYSFKENAGMSFIKLKEYEKAIKYLELSLKSKHKPDNGKSEFGLANSYNELGQKAKACDFIKIAMEKNYKPAFSLATSVCN